MRPVLESSTYKPTHCRCSLRSALWVCSTALLTVAAHGQAYSVEQGLPPSFLSPNPGLHWGRWDFHAGASVSGTYDDNINGSSTDAQDDFIWTFSPFGTARTEGPNGRSLAVTYRPSYLVYMDHSGDNALNHYGDLQINFPLNRLTLNLVQNAAVSSMVVRDIANRATQMTFGTSLNATYELGYKTSLQGQFGYTRLDYSEGDYFASQQFSEQLWADYHFRDNLSAGVGAGISQTIISQQPTQIGVAPQFRASWLPLPKLTIEGSVGFEFRDYGTGASTAGDPIMRISARYQFRPESYTFIEAHRAQQASALLYAENYVETGFSAGVTHRLMDRFNVTLEGGYSNADYRSTQTGTSAGRTDNYYFVRTSADTMIAQRWGTGIFYERRSNSSSNVYSYDENMVGLRVSWGF